MERRSRTLSKTKTLFTCGVRSDGGAPAALRVRKTSTAEALALLRGRFQTLGPRPEAWKGGSLSQAAKLVPSRRHACTRRPRRGWLPASAMMLLAGLLPRSLEWRAACCFGHFRQQACHSPQPRGLDLVHVGASSSAQAFINDFISMASNLSWAYPVLVAAPVSSNFRSEVNNLEATTEDGMEPSSFPLGPRAVLDDVISRVP